MDKRAAREGAQAAQGEPEEPVAQPARLDSVAPRERLGQVAQEEPRELGRPPAQVEQAEQAEQAAVRGQAEAVALDRRGRAFNGQERSEAPLTTSAQESMLIMQETPMSLAHFLA